MNALELFELKDGVYRPKVSEGMRFLFVGRSGSGKSTAIVSWPDPSYDFDCDNRFRGAIGAAKWLGIEKFKRIDFKHYNPSDGFDALDTDLNVMINDAEKKRCKYHTLAFESVGTLIFMLALDSQKKRGVKGSTEYMKGKSRGKVEFLHPDDYNYVSTALRLLIYNYIFPLNELGINTIFSAWVADRWGKKQNAKDYDPPEVIGEKILGPGNAVEEFMGYFDELYYFRKEDGIVASQPPKFTVEFSGGLAKSALGLSHGKHDITGKDFYSFWASEVNKRTEVPGNNATNNEVK